MARFLVPGFGFAFVYPDSWDYHLEGTRVSLFEPVRGVGALTFSSLTPPEGVVPDGHEILRSFLCVESIEQDSPVAGQTVHHGEADSERHWRFWAVTRPSRVTVVTYTCRLDQRGLEDGVVDEIVASISVHP